MIDYLNNVESEYRGIRRTLRTAATKNHVILIMIMIKVATGKGTASVA